MYSLAFSSSDQHLAATSDRGTVHVFALHQAAEGEEGSGQPPSHPPRSMSAAAAAAASSVAQGQLAAGASFLQSSSLSFVQGMGYSETISVVGRLGQTGEDWGRLGLLLGADLL